MERKQRKQLMEFTNKLIRLAASIRISAPEIFKVDVSRSEIRIDGV